MTTARDAAVAELENAIEGLNGYAPAVLESLEAVGYRLARQEQVGWRHSKAGFLISGVEPAPSEALRLVHPEPFEPVWRDLP